MFSRNKPRRFWLTFIRASVVLEKCPRSVASLRGEIAICLAAAKRREANKNRQVESRRDVFLLPFCFHSLTNSSTIVRTRCYVQGNTFVCTRNCNRAADKKSPSRNRIRSAFYYKQVRVCLWFGRNQLKISSVCLLVSTYGFSNVPASGTGIQAFSFDSCLIGFFLHTPIIESCASWWRGLSRLCNHIDGNQVMKKMLKLFFIVCSRWRS